ncbi:hypothetical protein MKW98_025971 [Papaver atlanticum]|uniref:Pentatricopeptide repeat-containing protein n=1 Tax=Papaver atlanticum TaxID=357466 RepID=A0AAD4XEA4_9MAGN|nr:hypothetical protein MKW98_011521 [Papaver atlanticum]KAI3926337.1 hypothetical protein MKW98_025971 [Papaver atlanticum]
MFYARNMFEEIPLRDRDVFIWNTLIRGYSDKGPCKEAIVVYKKMHENGFLPDHYTFPFVIRSCGVISGLREGREVHCNVIKHGFELNGFVQSSLVAMYSRNGEMSSSELVFEDIVEKDVVTWTSSIAGYVQNGWFMEGLDGFRRMVASGIHPNMVTLVSVLPACAVLILLSLGEIIHGTGVKLGVDSHLSFINALISMYGKCRVDDNNENVNRARSLFDGMVVRDMVSWNAMIAAYEQNKLGPEAIKLFQRMLYENVDFDYITLVSVISACAQSGGFNNGEWVHHLVTSKRLENNLSVTNALIDMYAKCGSIDMARDVFHRLPERTVVSWTAMIYACAVNGHGYDALEMFSRMLQEKVKPNSFTFIAVLTACKHSGLVAEGRKYYEGMKRDYSIVPSVEHCACMVDLLSRAGLLTEAYEFIEKMPVEPDAGVWGALLSACSIYENVEMAERVAEHVFKLDPKNEMYYVLMSKIYAQAGTPEKAARFRTLMKDRDLKKTPGYSSVEMYLRSHTFPSGSQSHPS